MLKSFLKKLSVVLLSIFILCGIALTWWANQPISLTTHAVDITIKPNSNLASVTRQLNRGGLKVEPIPMQVLARVLMLGGKLKSGSYEFEQGVTPYSVLNKMARGDVTQQVVTVIEGWEFRKMRAVIDQHPSLVHETAGLSGEELMNQLGSEVSSPEGMFFPDTYLFTAGTKDIDIYQRAYRAMQKKLKEAWANRAPNLPYETAYDALIMASLIEKETGQASERPLIAAVFINRLRSNMMLQTDPTVIYGLGENYRGTIYKKDLQTDTPYNTYKHTGLTPTPIALPGNAALQAALHPAESSALYFVARGDGSSQFSDNLKDHNRAVQTYQRGQ